MRHSRTNQSSEQLYANDSILNSSSNKIELNFSKFSNTYSIMPILIVISAFGPYIRGSIRLEHIVIYPLLILALFSFLLNKDRKVSYFPIIIALCFASIILFASLSTLFGLIEVDLSRVFSQVDNWLQPASIAVISFVWGKHFPKAINWCIGLLAINSMIQIYQASTGDIESIGAWVLADDSGISVASNSAQNGRYLGIFNQPFELGVAYSVTLIAWVYQVVRGQIKRTYALLSIVFIIIGGALCVSKAFIILMPFILIFQLLWEIKYNTINITWSGIASLVVALSIMIAIVVLSLSQWSGAEYLARLFDPSQANGNFLSFYSADRLGNSDTNVLANFAYIEQTSPIAGFGFSSVETVDNGWLDAYAQGGLPAVMFVLTLIIYMFFWGWNHRHTQEGRTLSIIAIYLSLAILGAPALTVNRASIILWVTIFAVYANIVKIYKIKEGKIL